MAPRLQINLNQLINTSFDNPGVRREVRKVMSKRTVAKEFGLRVIDRIKERTQDQNIDKNGKKFKGYADSYVKSSVFEIYGKTKDDVDLTLTEEMLSSMRVSDITSRTVAIDFTSEAQGKKAQGHIDGIPRYFGKTKGKVKRDFFGLPEADQREILVAVVKDFNEGDFDFNEANTAVSV